MIDRIQARRDALAQQLVEAQAQYDRLEAHLKQLDRQLCAMHGGVEAYDALLADLAEHSSTYATGLNGAHEAALEEVTNEHV